MCLSVLLGTTIFSKNLKADEGLYKVADVSSGSINVIENFDSYSSADNYFSNHKDEYGNLVLYEDDTVLKMEYGVVEFITNEACTLSIGYRSLLKNTTSSVNGCYGSDGAYLYSNDDASGVYFKIAGDIGYTDFDDVLLHPYELLDSGVSSYENIDGILTHKINSQLNNENYAYALGIDNSPSYIKSGINYYSYDGHYFYDDFYKMIDDYVLETYAQAVNYEDKYYNYYQYLPFRSLTNYDYSEIEDYFYNDLNIKDKIYTYKDINLDGANDVVNRSQYYDELKAFVEYQNIYGVNALLNLGVSMNESSYGKSLNSFLRNNLYNTNAYQNDEERQNDRYDKISDSVLAFTKYFISKKYTNYKTSGYCGLFLGDKLSGLNVDYTNDPYWGEKAVSNYYTFETKRGFKDLNSYCVGIVEDCEELVFYKDISRLNKIFSLEDVKEYSLIVIEYLGDVYKVQVDPSFNKTYEYDFNTCTAYINSNLVTKLLNKDKIHTNDMVSITFDVGEGSIDGSGNRTINVLKGTTPVVMNPEYDGYTFEGFDSKLETALEEKTYVAKYKKIESTSIQSGIKSNIKQGDYIDLSDSVLTCVYENGTKQKVKINTNMINDVDTNDPLTSEVIVTYNGVSISTPITISEKSKQLDEEISALINNNIGSYEYEGTYNPDDIKTIKQNLTSSKHNFTANEIRTIDEIMLKLYHGHAYYRIDENDFDLSVSGMALSLADEDITSWFKLFRNTYYIRVLDIPVRDKNTLTSIGNSYGFTPVKFFRLEYSYNMKEKQSNGPIDYSIRIDDKDPNNIYTVYRLDDNGDVVKCRTTQSLNYIDFISEKSGSFVVLTKKSVNQYRSFDYKENITADTTDPDNLRLFIMGATLLSTLLLGVSLILNYYILEYRRKVVWRGYKKSLQKVVFVLGEKQKN